MRIKNQKDFWAGIMFIGFGAFFGSIGTTYEFGTSARMGPAFFPVALSVIMMFLGILVAIGGMSASAETQKVAKFDWRTLILVLGPIVLFGLLLQPLGLVLTLIMLIGISSYASHEFSWKATVANAAFLIALCLLVFVYALKLQFQIWPSFLGA